MGRYSNVAWCGPCVSNSMGKLPSYLSLVMRFSILAFGSRHPIPRRMGVVHEVHFDHAFYKRRGGICMRTSYKRLRISFWKSRVSLQRPMRFITIPKIVNGNYGLFLLSGNGEQSSRRFRVMGMYTSRYKITSVASEADASSLFRLYHRRWAIYWF